MLQGPRSSGAFVVFYGLGFPKADKDKLSTLLDQSQSILDKIKKDPSSALGSSNPFAGVNKQLTSYGLTSCGSS